jgi:hypothetical protein
VKVKCEIVYGKSKRHPKVKAVKFMDFEAIEQQLKSIQTQREKTALFFKQAKAQKLIKMRQIRQKNH